MGGRKIRPRVGGRDSVDAERTRGAKLRGSWDGKIDRSPP